MLVKSIIEHRQTVAKGDSAIVQLSPVMNWDSVVYWLKEMHWQVQDFRLLRGPEEIVIMEKGI